MIVAVTVIVPETVVVPLQKHFAPLEVPAWVK